MTKLFNIGLLVLLITANVNAQTKPIQEQVDNQYVNSKHKQFLYMASPINKIADEKLIQNRIEFEEGLNKYPERYTTANADTSWSYAESIGFYDSVFTPQSYSHSFQTGDTTNSILHFNQYGWYLDSLRWSPTRIQTSFVNENYYDSVTTYFYRVYEDEPYTGNRARYPREPVNNADVETFWDYYQPNVGWVPSTWSYSFQNEKGWDTLKYEYSYDSVLEEYQLSYRYRYDAYEDYYFNEYSYFYRGFMTQLSISEVTSEFELSETKYFDHEENISDWSYEYLKKLENGAYDYYVTKEYDSESMMLQDVDSTQFYYYDNNTVIESKSFYWDDSLWVFNELYKSFQTEISENSFQVDSIIIYEVQFNPETMQSEVGAPYIKTLLNYDGNGNQVEVINYSIINDSLQIHNKTIREFAFINGYYNQIKQDTYNYDHTTDMLYLSGATENNYDGDTYVGNSYFQFSAAGDTTYGYITQYEELTDGSRADVRFEWDWTLQKLVLKSYRINNRQITGDNGSKYNQTVYSSFNPTDGSQAINRSMNGYNAYPGIFNDGPINVSLGDTLSLYLSARNPDMSIPEIEVSNLPSTATFNPNTRKLFWVVDEESPGPMLYTARRGDLSVTAEVEFINENFTVENEEMSLPNTFDLGQNYPNPFNPSTNINFELPESGSVSLKVYNVLGQEVASLVNQRMASGAHTIRFDASRLSSGVYIYRLVSGNQVQTKKMMLIK